MTGAGEWGFLIDENLDRKTVGYLETEDIRGEHVSGVLEPGADDFDDILPYARAEDLIVVTNNILDSSRSRTRNTKVS